MNQTSKTRLHSIDALRGLIMLFMLLDHVRETFFLHRQVSDPMDVTATEPGLFFSRALAHLCAPLFVFLTGLSAFLYGEKNGGGTVASAFLFKRGLFLIVLEITLVNFAWTFQFPPTVIYLQVIWAIGLSMLALAALRMLTRPVLAVVGLLIIAGHNLLDGVHFPVESMLHGPWAVLHDRGWLEPWVGLRLRTSYPVLPWVGVIVLGYAAGPWFAAGFDQSRRQARLTGCGEVALLLFIGLRLNNGYGEKPWQIGVDGVHSLMGFFNITKYPPSLLFICLTLGLGLLLLTTLERLQERKWIAPLVVFGAAPMFFYLLHLYVLKVLYLAALGIWGANQDSYFGFDTVMSVWLCAALLAVMLYPAVHWFAGVKVRRRDLAWLKYL
jgi:uncharacterized membrane protein